MTIASTHRIATESRTSIGIHRRSHGLAPRRLLRSALEIRSGQRKPLAILIPCLLAMALATGCASKKGTEATARAPRPAHIWVQDFAATPAELPANSTLADQYAADAKLQTPEHIATGRKLGAQISTELVEHLRGMGMPSERAVPGTTPSMNDIVIRGYLVLIVKGSLVGSDSSELKVADQGDQMTDQGLRQLWTGTTDAGGHKSAGGALGVATFVAFHNPVGLIVNAGKKVHAEMSGSNKPEAKATQAAKGIADALKKRFQEQAWIK